MSTDDLDIIITMFKDSQPESVYSPRVKDTLRSLSRVFYRPLLYPVKTTYSVTAQPILSAQRPAHYLSLQFSMYMDNTILHCLQTAHF